jgi:hypothetical protein
VVRLVQAGLGTCYVGCLNREEEARVRFGLPEGARVAAAVIYGYAASGRGDRLINGVVRRAAGATRKLAPERLFFDGSFDRPSPPPGGLQPLVEAARSAPSADNAQPWRFLWHQGMLYLYVLRKSWRYDVGGSQDYRLHDGGICMANVALAMEAIEVEGQWSLVKVGDVAPPCPAHLEPLAVLHQ